MVENDGKQWKTAKQRDSWRRMARKTDAETIGRTLNSIIMGLASSVYMRWSLQPRDWRMDADFLLVYELSPILLTLCTPNHFLCSSIIFLSKGSSFEVLGTTLQKRRVSVVTSQKRVVLYLGNYRSGSGVRSMNLNAGTMNWFLCPLRTGRFAKRDRSRGHRTGPRIPETVERKYATVLGILSDYSVLGSGNRNSI